MGTTLRTRNASYQINLRNAFVEKILPALKDGSAKTIVDKVYDWNDVAKAHSRMESKLYICSSSTDTYRNLTCCRGWVKGRRIDGC